MDPDQNSGAGASSSSRDNDTSYQRRREQVRRAQRIHRDRKAAYVTALEREVEDLRAENEAFKAGKQKYNELIRSNRRS